MITRRMRAGSDDGVTLILVLIIITVVGLVMGAVLAYADTSLSTTVALRGKTGGTYGIDAAGNAYLALLRNGAQCANEDGTTSHLGNGVANPFYSPTGSSSDAVNATIRCTPDVDNGLVTKTIITKSGHGVAITDANLPDYAVLALRQYSRSTQQSISSTGQVCILNGDVASNGVISATGTFGVRNGNCSSGSGSGRSVQAYRSARRSGCSGTFTPTSCTRLASLIARPAQPAPTEPIGQVNPTPVCDASGTYAAFRPGKYTDVDLLNSPCSGTASFEWFSPGTYYFDYGSTPWQWPSTLLAGTPTSGPSVDSDKQEPVTPVLAGIDPTQASTLTGLAGTDPNAGCADPAAQKQYAGAEFVFGGSSRVVATGGSAQICASYSPGSTPTAIYGEPNSGGSVSQQSLCTPVGAPTTCTDALIGITGADVAINGYVYAPAAAVTINSPDGNLFNWGAAVLTLGINGSSSPTVQLPVPNSGYTEDPTTVTINTYKYVDVWTCPASSSPCSTSGSPDLRIKVQYEDDGGKVTVLSWSATP